ncbi:hypothetical protein CAEBREN_23314 [Caenorhabditis brenneri]|uniref:Uncharacterized protein n=1 Tax=Caenorhabditis brenneri TaxID=135651 RepID=G0P6L1_CAEBE|nr:hypothetical protein CAEBREN_23314 [Caenorhabditis brenneri]
MKIFHIFVVLFLILNVLQMGSTEEVKATVTAPAGGADCDADGLQTTKTTKKTTPKKTIQWDPITEGTLPPKPQRSTPIIPI